MHAFLEFCCLQIDFLLRKYNIFNSYKKKQNIVNKQCLELRPKIFSLYTNTKNKSGYA